MLHAVASDLQQG